jgi:hypothetical protein
MLAHTFDESPIFHSAFPVPERRSKASRAIFAAVLKDGMRFGRVQIARNPEIVGALIWYLPGCYPPGLVRKVRLLADYARVAAADLGGFIKVTRAEAIVAQLHPPERTSMLILSVLLVATRVAESAKCSPITL